MSYFLLWTGGAVRRVGLVWWIALGIFLVAMLLRDGWRGRSPGKRLMALTILTPTGAGCGYGRSVLRNLPLVLPGWNLIEAAIVFFGSKGRRSGDRLARTSVVEE